MQQLVIRLASQLDSPIQWLRYDNTENEVIASGELANASQFDTLLEHSKNAEVIALAPTSDVLITQVELPKKHSRKMLSAVPYMLEDKLCFDVDTQFVAKGEIKNDQLLVAVVDKTKLKFWKRLLEDADIFCQRLIPDSLLLPMPKDNDVNLVQINDALLVRFSENNALQGEASWLLPAISEQGLEEDGKLKAFSEIDTSLMIDELKEKIEYDYERLPLDLLRHNINSNSLNLFQAEFAVKAKSNPIWEKWKVAAVLAVIALSVNLIVKTVELNQLKSERAALNEQITNTVREAFPNIQRVRKSTLKRTISEEVKRLENTGGGASMLAMLSQMTTAFASTGVTPQTLTFNSSRTELRMQSVADNFDALERFRRDVAALGLTVEQGAINNQGDQVVGVIVIKG